MLFVTFVLFWPCEYKEVEHRRAIDRRRVGYTCTGDLRRLLAAAANPAPVDASDMSFDEYADDLLDVVNHGGSLDEC